MPTVWLQERLKLPQPPWWEVVISTVYMSFFILPYVVAAVLWLRNRDEWKAFVQLFVGLSFAALVIYALLPAAPPWAAARCTAGDVAGGPSDRGACSVRPAECPTADCSAPCRPTRTAPTRGSNASSTRGWGKLQPALGECAHRPGSGQRQPGRGDPVAARGADRAIAAFLWHRVHRKWRPLLVAYVLIMAFTLVYTAEHYVVDILLGWVLAAVVIAAISRYESRRQRAAAQDPPSAVPDT